MGATVKSDATGDLAAVHTRRRRANGRECLGRATRWRRPKISFAFDAHVGPQPAENLRASLEAIGAVCAVDTVRVVQPPDEFVRSGQSARSAARHALERREQT